MAQNVEDLGYDYVWPLIRPPFHASGVFRAFWVNPGGVLLYRQVRMGW